jgi:tetratricopeptide (TPR) repeat protein
VLEVIASLAEQSLLRREEGADGEARFGMLETIREFAREKLAEAGEGEDLRRRHAANYLSLAQEADRELHGPRQAAWLDRLEADHDNLRAALAYYLEAGAAESAPRLVAALHWFWYVRGHATEGRGWLERALGARRVSSGGADPDGTRPDSLTAAALYAAGHLALFQGDYAAARPYLVASAEISRALGDGPRLLDALAFLGMAASHLGDGAGTQAAVEELATLSPSLTGMRERAQLLFNYGRRALLWWGDGTEALALLEQSLGLYRALGDDWSMSHILVDLGLIALSRGDVSAARARHEEGLVLARALKDRALIAAALNNLGEVARCEDDYARAAALYGEGLDLYRKQGNRQDIPRLLHNLGYVALREGDAERAEALFRQGLDLFREIGVERGIAEGLAGLAAVAAARAGGPPDASRAARLWGAAEAWHTARGAPLWPADRAERDRYVPVARARVDEATFAAAWAEGSAMGLERGAAYASREACGRRNTAPTR